MYCLSPPFTVAETKEAKPLVQQAVHLVSYVRQPDSGVPALTRVRACLLAFDSARESFFLLVEIPF